MRDSFTQRRFHHVTGFALVEALVGIAILGLLTVAVTSLATLGTRSSLDAERRTVALGLATQKIEEIRGLAYDSVNLTTSIPPGVLLPAETVERNTQSYQVTTAVATVDDPITSSSATDYKQATITVSYTVPGGAVRDVTLSTYVTRPVSIAGGPSASPSGSPSPSPPPSLTPSAGTSPSADPPTPPPSCTPSVDLRAIVADPPLTEASFDQIWAADLTGDGRQDLLLRNRYAGTGSIPDREFYLLPGNGNGTFALSSALALPNITNPEYVPGTHLGEFQVAIGEFDGESGVDVAYTEFYEITGILVFPGIQPTAVQISSDIGLAITGPMQPIRLGGLTATVDSLVVGVKDGADVSQVAILSNAGDGTFSVAGYLPRPTGVSFPADVDVADFNRDGLPDVFVLWRTSTGTAFTGRVYLSNLAGTFSALSSFSVPHNSAPAADPLLAVEERYRLAQVADIDVDGDNDLLIPMRSASSLPYLWRNTGGGAFFSLPNVLTFGLFDEAHILNLNAGSYPDLIATAPSTNEVQKYLNTNGGLLTAPTAVPMKCGPASQRYPDTALADFDGNGYTDVILLHETNRALSVFLNNGSDLVAQ